MLFRTAHPAAASFDCGRPPNQAGPGVARALAGPERSPDLPGRKPLRVVSIAHTAVSRANGRLRYQPLASCHDLDVHLVAPERWHEFGRSFVADQTRDPGITLHTLPIRLKRAGPAKWYLHHYRGIGRLIASLRPDVIHLWEEPWSVVALQVCRLRNRLAPAAGLVLEVDQNILKRLPPPFEQIRRYVLGATDHLLTRSADAAAVARANGYDGPATPIGYGVNQAIFQPRDRAGLRRTWDIAGFTIGYAGRLVVEKGLDDVLDALRQTSPDVRLAILGDGPHAPALRARVSALGLDERVKWFHWDAPGQVGAFMNCLDALVLVTRTTSHVREQFGRVIIEAHACGVPVIGSDCGTIPQILGEGGWVVPERDPAALAMLLDRLRADPGRVAAAGAIGLRQVSARFTFDHVAQALRTAWLAAATARSGI